MSSIRWGVILNAALFLGALPLHSQISRAPVASSAKPGYTQPTEEEVVAGQKVCPAMYAQFLARGKNYAPPRNFVQVKTAFGPKTALKDERRSLLWLHLNFTKGMSYDQVKAEMASGSLAGWRFAKPKELEELFLDFAGPQSGPLKNDRRATWLQHELGGPVDFTANAENGFCRNSSVGLIDQLFGLGHAMYGYIANDNFFGPSIDPKLQGSSRDDSGARFAASYLVKEEQGNRVWRAVRRWFSWL